jgi:transcriptional antiterminator RfaH
MPSPKPSAGPAWHCLRTRKKAEHLAAHHVTQLAGVEVFCPRLRLLRPTRRGRRWFVESMFPCYLFARFDPIDQLRAVRHAHHVTGLVHFGGELATLSESEIAALRTLVGPEEIREVQDSLREGDPAEILTGPLRGLEAVVTRVLPARDRVRLLLEFLGSQREVDVSRNVVGGPERPPPGLAR